MGYLEIAALIYALAYIRNEVPYNSEERELAELKLKYLLKKLPDDSSAANAKEEVRLRDDLLKI